MADRVLVMYLGEIVEMGSRDIIFQAPLHPYTHGLLAATLIGQEKLQGARHISQLKGEVTQVHTQTQGCKLYGRCGYAKEECQEPQTLREIRPDHWVRCWRAKELGLETKTAFTNPARPMV